MYICIYKKSKENKKERARESRTSITATPRNDSRGPGVCSIYIYKYTYMYICVNAERDTHQCTYTYRYIPKTVKSSLSSFRPERTHERESSTNEREPMHAPLRVSVSYPACLRRLERRLVCIVGTLKNKRAKERLDVWYTYVYTCKLLWAACLHAVCCCELSVCMLCAAVWYCVL